MAANPWEVSPESVSISQKTQQFAQKVSDLPLQSWETRSEASRSSRYGASRSSRSNGSTVSSRKADAVANAAALEAKLRFMDEEMQLKGKLEKLQTIKQLHMAKSQVTALSKLEREEEGSCRILESLLGDEDEDKEVYVQEYIKTLPTPVPHVAVPHDAQCSSPVISPPVAFSDVGSHHVDRSAANGYVAVAPPPVAFSDVNVATHHVDRPTANRYEDCRQPYYAGLNPVAQEYVPMSSQLQAIVNAGRLPIPEPGVFTGNCLEYPTWEAAFNTLIARNGVRPEEKIYHLKRYVGGEAKEAIEGYMLLTSTSPNAYHEAMKILKERYGDPFMIANAFRQRIDSWPKIPSRDPAALRKYGDFLRQCEAAMNANRCLRVLDDAQENRRMVAKLPDWLVNRWRRVVVRYKEEKQDFPPFRHFAHFIQEEAMVANEPTLIEMKDHAAKPATKTKPSLRSASLATKTKPSLRSASLSTETKPARPCPCCEKDHPLNACKDFVQNKTLQERKEFIKAKGLCFGCLKSGHLSKACKHRAECESCSKRHPTALHGDVRDPKPVEGSPPAAAAVSHTSHVAGSKQCSMILPVYLSHVDSPDDERLVYALLDTQSDTSFVLEEECNRLGVCGTDVKLMLSTMTAENTMIDSKKMRGLQVRGYDSDLKISLPAVFTRDIMPANRQHIPTPEVAMRWPHLTKIKDKLQPIQDCEVALLLGYNCPQALVPREVIPCMGNGPYGQRTDLGWGIVGIIDPDEVDCDMVGVSHHVITVQVPEPAITMTNRTSTVQFAVRNPVKEVLRIMELDFVEQKQDQRSLSVEDRKFLALMQEGIHQEPNGHYEMPLPFKTSQPVNLPNNRVQALQRLNQLKKRLEKDKTYKQDYYHFMENIIKKEYAEEVPKDELENLGHTVWYIPHHGIYSSKKPDKIRIVFDCSARYQGQSLNDHLLQGPDLINGLVGVLCRFRSDPVALMCDVEQMFFQFSVEPCHRDFLRFLWWKDENMTKPVEYRMKVHLFGAVSSPGCANFALKKVADDNEGEFGFQAAEFIRRDFYVDDGLTSVPTADEAVNLIHSTRKICAKGGLHLHKFVSNSAQVMATIPPDDRAKTAKDINLCDSMPLERALGVQWCIESDTFQFRIILKDQPLTRRGILSTISSIYDPLGFLAPVMLVGKQILQEMCREGLDWDSKLSDALQARWERWRNNLKQLETLEIKRCCKPDNFGEVKKAELHHFSDASTGGYGQCSYLRLVNQQNHVHCTLMMGKSRVTPLKVVTIPRLELTAAVVSVRVSNLLRRELRPVCDLEETFWTDSKIVLGYILNESRRFHVFVGNRVQQIRDNTDPDQWRYVKTDDNPADDASRGITPHDLMTASRWLTGPDFLWKEEIARTEIPDPETTVFLDDPEVKRTVTSATSVEEHPSCLDPNRLGYFSSWNRARRAVANCLRLKALLKQRVLNKKAADPAQQVDTSGTLTVLDLGQAEKEIIKGVQAEVFHDELKLLKSMKLPPHTPDRKNAKERNQAIKGTSCLYRLDPYLDDDGIIRVGGRLRRAGFPLEIKHPAILPRKHHITELLIRHCHELVEHQGRGMTTNEIRSHGFWIIGCSSAVSYAISTCVVCKRLRSSALVQKMADLPTDRVEPSPPFSYCAVDYFGPFLIKEGRRELKRYGVLFTCMACRAIHIETAASLSTDSFINALRRFITIRGPIRQLRSDKGTNFVGAEAELKKACLEMDTQKVRNFLMKENCDLIEFNMNVPSASHMGGAWERQIRTVRNILASLMSKAGTQLDDESLRTFMNEAMAIVNSRPLTLDNINDPTSLEPLTPNHLLTQKSRIVLPPPGEFQREDLYSRKRWRRVQHLANEFWARWKQEYLQDLQIRPKWNRPRRDLQQGDIVIIKEDEVPRNKWRLARVEETYMDEDKHVRKVKLAISDKSLNSEGKRTRPLTFLERPIHKLVLLLESEN